MMGLRSHVQRKTENFEIQIPKLLGHSAIFQELKVHTHAKDPMSYERSSKPQAYLPKLLLP